MASKLGVRLGFAPLNRLAAVVTVAAGSAAFGGAWYLGESLAGARRDARAAQVRTEIDATADAAGSLLAVGDLSGARRLVASLGQSTVATSCRLEISGGRVLADMVASRINQQFLPDPWPIAAPDSGDGEWQILDGAIHAAVPVRVGEGRSAVLLLEAPASPGFGATDSLSRAGVIGLATSLLTGLAMLRGRRRMRDLVAVGEAVAAAAAGEPHEAALRVSEEFGALAAAWNIIVPRLAGGEIEPSGELGLAAEGAADQDGRGVCDTMWQGVLVVDTARRVRYLNGAAALLLSVRREAAIGMDAADLLGHPETIEAVVRAASGDTSVRASFERVSSEGGEEGILRISVRPLRAHGGAESAFVLIEDITQQRLAERSRNAFLAHATHELRTPLTNIRLYVEELIEGGDHEATERARCLEVISGESRRLERMVSDMLSISEIEAGTMRLRTDDVRLEPMLRELERDFQAMAAEKRIRFECKLPPKLPTIVADRDKVTMTLANLLGNALKYTPEEGTVSLVVKPGANEIRFEVTDSGIGIRDDEQELVFRTFYRSSDTRLKGIAGTGLGLPIARQIARLHGGDITLASEVDSGSTFTLILPLKTPVSLAA